MFRKSLFAAASVALAGLALAPVPAGAQDKLDLTKAPREALVYFHNVREGMKIPQRYTVRIGLRNMGVAPAGVDQPETGHHHLLVDVDTLPKGEPIPNDFNHIHLGNGQTEVQLNLTPGKHTLQLLLGDHRHVPHDPPVRSPKVSVTVRPSTETAGQ